MGVQVEALGLVVEGGLEEALLVERVLDDAFGGHYVTYPEILKRFL